MTLLVDVLIENHWNDITHISEGGERPSDHFQCVKMANFLDLLPIFVGWTGSNFPIVSKISVIIRAKFSRTAKNADSEKDSSILTTIVAGEVSQTTKKIVQYMGSFLLFSFCKNRTRENQFPLLHDVPIRWCLCLFYRESAKCTLAVSILKDRSLAIGSR